MTDALINKNLPEEFTMERQELWLANNLIRSASNFTVNEGRLIYLLITKIKRELEKGENFETTITARELEEACGISFSAAITILKTVCTAYDYDKNEKLPAPPIQQRFVSLLEDGNRVWLNWISTVEYSNSWKGDADMASVKLGLHHRLNQYVSNLRVDFTKLFVDEVLPLKHPYSASVWQSLMRWKNQTGMYRPTVADFREAVGLDIKRSDDPYIPNTQDDEPAKYTRMGDLVKRVVKPSINEIFEKNHLVVDFERIKQGRCIKYLLFRYDPRVCDLATKEARLVWQLLHPLDEILDYKTPVEAISKLRFQRKTVSYSEVINAIGEPPKEVTVKNWIEQQLPPILEEFSEISAVKDDGFGDYEAFINHPEESVIFSRAGSTQEKPKGESSQTESEEKPKRKVSSSLPPDEASKIRNEIVFLGIDRSGMDLGSTEYQDTTAAIEKLAAKYQNIVGEPFPNEYLEEMTHA